MIVLLFLLGLQTVDHRDIVVAIKQQVLAIGINPDAPAPDECARWEITRRVVIALQSEGAGHIAKGGNNCRGYAVDAIMYQDGTVVDILGAGREGPNTPLWLIQPNRRPSSDWRPAVELESIPTPVPEPQPQPQDLSAVVAKLDQILYTLEQLRLEQAEDTEKIQKQIDQVVKNAEKSAPKVLDWLVKALTLGLAGAGAAKD
jgi:hypothetical protein